MTKNRIHAVTIRMSTIEMKRLRRVAKRAGTDASTVVRQLIKVADDERAVVVQRSES